MLQNYHMRKPITKTVLLVTMALCVAFAAFTFESKEAITKPAANIPGYRWIKATSEAAFSKSYNFQLFSHNDLLWAFHPDGNYYSNNGKDWTRSGLPNSIQNLAFLDYVQFNNSILGLGHFEGNSERYTLRTSITQTSDMRSWNTLAGQSNLPGRFFYHPVVFNNKIWIYGGTSDGENKYDDAWSSADGISWKKEAEHLPFGKRSGQQFLVFKNKLYMLDNDVWSSDDGLNWSKVTDRITDASLFGYTAVEFDDNIWLLGCNRNGQFASKVCFSSDGKNWQEQDAPWSPRGGVAAAVYNGKLYMTGGKYGGFRQGTTETEFVYSNDVWVLEKTGE